MSLVRQHELAAKKMADDQVAAAQGFFHAGIAVECALKAYIWHLERFNQWPDKNQRPDLHTHDLRSLKDIAQIKIKVTDAEAPSWHVVLQWMEIRLMIQNQCLEKLRNQWSRRCLELMEW